jgi:F0F1-type ATP synthase membrane subunit c/vacuolar-type H+-ATPase subunit K
MLWAGDALGYARNPRRSKIVMEMVIMVVIVE